MEDKIYNAQVISTEISFTSIGHHLAPFIQIAFMLDNGMQHRIGYFLYDYVRELGHLAKALEAKSYNDFIGKSCRLDLQWESDDNASGGSMTIMRYGHIVKDTWISRKGEVGKGENNG